MYQDLYLDLSPDLLPLTLGEDGIVRLTGHRITLMFIMECYLLQSRTADQIAGEYELDPADVHSVIGYCLRHREEVNAYLEEIYRRSDEYDRKMAEKGVIPPDWQERLRERARAAWVAEGLLPE